MAIYYINPHTTTNGTGTFASPWSLGSTSRTGLANGDEIRILGVALTDLLTATSYTATVTNNYQLTITAGGGLGADWAAGDVAYLPDFDTFFKVSSVSTNIIQTYLSNSALPINDWSTTTVTVRKVNVSSYPVSTTSSYNVTGTFAFNNITVSDCWTNATTRVTDGSVKSLFNTSGTSTADLYLDYSSATGSVSGWTVNLQNTHVMNGNGTTSGFVAPRINGSNSTYNIKQIFSWGTNGSGIRFSTNMAGNTTLTIGSYYNVHGIGNELYGKNITINITNLFSSSTNLFGNAAGTRSPNNTLNITNYLPLAISNSSLVNNTNSAPITVNITGNIDLFPSTVAISIVQGFGNMTLNIGSGVVYYRNKRASTTTSFTNAWSFIGAAAYGDTIEFGKVNISNGWTTTGAEYNTTTVLPNTPYKSTLPQEFTISYPNDSIVANSPYFVSNVNTLIVFRDGSSPKELLGPSANGDFSSGVNNTAAIVTTDSSVYRTTGPSLKSYLNTRTNTLWGNPNAQVAKTIKIPCTASTSYTVSGYVRTDETAYVDGDCRVSIFLNGVEVTGQNMTTSCENAWEGFTLTFTASLTAEYVFVWKMYYTNGDKSYWLDDLTIS